MLLQHNARLATEKHNLIAGEINRMRQDELSTRTPQNEPLRTCSTHTDDQCAAIDRDGFGHHRRFDQCHRDCGDPNDTTY